MLNRILSCSALVALASPAMAQWQPYGSLIMDGSQNMVTVNLGFNFTMPGGSVVTAVDVDEYGRVIEVGSDTYDGSESTSEMTSNPGASINVLWDTVTYTASENSSVFYYTDNTSIAAITWYEVNSPGNTTFQVQLHASGDIYMLYDSRNPVDDGIIGLCPGNGATLPAQSDLSTALAGNLATTDPTIFEDFGFTAGVDAVDWVSALFIYTPNGVGGSGGWNVTGVPGIPDPQPAAFAVNEDLGAGCPGALATPTSYFFIPDGLGNYDVSASPSLFDPNIGPSLGIASDDGRQDGYDFGFSFPWPDGYTASGFSIDPNGRLLPDNTVDGGDYTPTAAEHAGATGIALFQTDMNVNEPNSGNIHLATNPGVSATVTWNEVKQYDSSDRGLPGLTYQITLYPNGSFVITHEDVLAFNDPVLGAIQRDLLVGCSDGSGVVPAEVDFTGIQSSPINVPVGVVYEWWDASGTSPVEPTDLITPLPAYRSTLVAQSTPLLGTTWTLEIQDVGSSLFGFYVLGGTQTATDLTQFGSPCELQNEGAVILGTTPTGTGTMQPLNVPVPINTAFIGFEMIVQGVTEGAPTPPFTGFAGLPFTIDLTNGILGRFGSI